MEKGKTKLGSTRDSKIAMPLAESYAPTAASPIATIDASTIPLPHDPGDLDANASDLVVTVG